MLFDSLINKQLIAACVLYDHRNIYYDNCVPYTRTWSDPILLLLRNLQLESELGVLGLRIIKPTQLLYFDTSYNYNPHFMSKEGIKVCENESFHNMLSSQRHYKRHQDKKNNLDCPLYRSPINCI